MSLEKHFLLKHPFIIYRLPLTNQVQKDRSEFIGDFIFNDDR